LEKEKETKRKEARYGKKKCRGGGRDNVAAVFLSLFLFLFVFSSLFFPHAFH